MLFYAGSRGCAKLTSEPWNMYAFPLHICAGVFPKCKSRRIVDEIYANFLKYNLCVGFNDFQRFGRKKFEVWDVAFNEPRSFNFDRSSFSASRCTATTSFTCCYCRVLMSSPFPMALQVWCLGNDRPFGCHCHLRPLGGECDIENLIRPAAKALSDSCLWRFSILGRCHDTAHSRPPSYC